MAKVKTFFELLQLIDRMREEAGALIDKLTDK